MHSNRIVIGALFFIASTLSVETALPNGINPPRPSGATAVTTLCKEKQNDNELKIFRTRIKYGNKPAKTIKFRIGGTTEQLALSSIGLITLGASSVDSDGFVKAYLVRSDDTERIPVMLQVKQNDKVLRFSGFTEDGAAVNIDSTNCKSMGFSSSTTSSGEDSDEGARPPKLK